jgi:hypothetical protein
MGLRGTCCLHLTWSCGQQVPLEKLENFIPDYTPSYPRRQFQLCGTIISVHINCFLQLKQADRVSHFVSSWFLFIFFILLNLKSANCLLALFIRQKKHALCQIMSIHPSRAINDQTLFSDFHKIWYKCSQQIAVKQAWYSQKSTQ